jgi:hypothetical protein
MITRLVADRQAEPFSGRTWRKECEPEAAEGKTQVYCQDKLGIFTSPLTTTLQQKNGNRMSRLGYFPAGTSPLAMMSPLFPVDSV